MIQLNPYIPLFTPVGYCEAFAFADLGDDQNPLFYCFSEKGIVCVFDSTEVRRIPNTTHGSKVQVEFPPEVMERWKKLREI